MNIPHPFERVVSIYPVVDERLHHRVEGVVADIYVCESAVREVQRDECVRCEYALNVFHDLITPELLFYCPFLFFYFKFI